MTMCSTRSDSRDLNPAVSDWLVLHDSRDVQDKPSKGWLLNFNNVAYRESIAGSNNFDVYRLDYTASGLTATGNVVAVRQSNQWTVDAPPERSTPRYSLRGYTIGEYLGKNMSSLEVEERYMLPRSAGPPRSFAGGGLPLRRRIDVAASPTTSTRAIRN